MNNTNFTFENFMVSNSNRFAYDVAVEVAKNPARNFNPLYIYGKSGLGKTHLLLAIEDFVQKKNSNWKIYYKESRDFVTDLINSIKDDEIEEFYKKYEESDFLLIDNIQELCGKEATLQNFLNIFDRMINEFGKQVVITAEGAPNELEYITTRLLSRFEVGLIVGIDAPDNELKKAIAENEARQLGITLDDEVIKFIVCSRIDNINQIKGIVKKIFSMGNKFDITQIDGLNNYISKKNDSNSK